MRTQLGLPLCLAQALHEDAHAACLSGEAVPAEALALQDADALWLSGLERETSLTVLYALFLS